MDVGQLEKGLIREQQQLSKLRVGLWVTEAQAKQGSQKAGSKLGNPVGSGSEARKGQGVSQGWSHCGCCLFWRVTGSGSCAQHTSPRHSCLLAWEFQAVVLPSSTLGSAGERLRFVFLMKALYGLRKAPLYWFKKIKAALLSMGVSATSEPKVFRYSRPGHPECLRLILFYVGDLLAQAIKALVSGRYKSFCPERWFVPLLSRRDRAREQMESKNNCYTPHTQVFSRSEG